MNRRARVVGVVGVLVALLLGLGGWFSASADTPEGEGTTLNVTPSDDLPISSVSKVVLAGAFPEGQVMAAQCYPTFGSCGSESELLSTGVTGEYAGDLVLVRMLTVFDPGADADTTVDCAKDVCAVWITAGSFGSHRLTFSPLDPTTTTISRQTTTTSTSVLATITTPTTKPATTTTKPAVGVTIPATTTTKAKATTTTVKPATMSTAPSTSTTLASTTTTSTTVAPPPVNDAPTLIAVTTKNTPSGPPGGALQVQGRGYTCPTVYFFFDGTRVGSAKPNAAGNVAKSGLSVPGDTSAGARRVTASCDPDGATVAQAVFQVLPVAVHRPAFVTSLPLPSQISLDPGSLALSAAVALGAIMLIAFPFELFNSSMEENYDEVRGWFGLGPRGVPEVHTRSNYVPFFAMIGVTALACGFLSPDFGLNRTSVVLFIGICVALLVMAVAFSLPADIGIRRQFGEWGKLNFLPGSVIVTIVMVALCRIFEFQPGFFYGALAGLAFRSALSEKVQGKMTAANWLFSLVLSMGAFFLRVPVSAAAGEPGSSIWWIGVEICLALIFLWGIEGLAVGMLPMRFLDGRKVMRWSKPAWAALFFLGVFATVHVLLRPGSGYVGSTSDTVRIGVMVVFAACGLGSILFWAYFRFRPARWAAARA